VSDRYTEAAKKIEQDVIARWSRLDVEGVAAILRESFPEPAPAEQGDGLDEKWLAQWFASKKRAFNVQMGLASLPRLGDPIPPSHYLADYMGREIKALIEQDRLASRPQPEAACPECAGKGVKVTGFLGFKPCEACGATGKTTHPQPAPAEQGEGLVSALEKLQRSKEIGSAALLSWQESAALLASRPQPEAMTCKKCKKRLSCTYRQYNPHRTHPCNFYDSECQPGSPQPEAAQDMREPDEGNYWMISTYPNLAKDDPMRKAYFAGVHDAEARLASTRDQGEASTDAKRCAVLAWRSNDHPGGMDWIDTAAIVIEDFAKRYTERKGEEMRAALEKSTECLRAMNQSPAHAASWVEPRSQTVTHLIAENDAALATPAEGTTQEGEL
jgi:hypothetical protein